MESSEQNCLDLDLCIGSFIQQCWHNSTDNISVALRVQTSGMVVILVMSILLNFIVLVTIACNKRLHTVPNVFAISLACSDILLAAVADINTVLSLNEHNLVSRQMNILLRVFVFFTSFTMICNHLNHLMISMERWMYIARPFQHQRLVTTRVIAFCILTIWIIPFVGSANILAYDCNFRLDMVRFQFSVVFSSLHFSMSVWQFAIYSHIAVITRRQSRRIMKTRVSVASIDMNEVDKILLNLRGSWKQVRMFVIAFGSFFVFETPWVSANIFAFTSNDEEFYKSRTMKIAVLFSLFQCYSNFLARIFLDVEFRLALKQNCVKICTLQTSTSVHPANAKAKSVNSCCPIRSKNRPLTIQVKPIGAQSITITEEGNTGK